MLGEAVRLPAPLCRRTLSRSEIFTRGRSHQGANMSPNSFEPPPDGRQGLAIPGETIMTRLPLAALLSFTLALSAPALAQEPPAVDNPRMAQIYQDDQTIRAGVSAARRPDRAFVERMQAEDAARRAEVRALLDQGAIRSAEDFRRAAYVFQHGSQPDDYLLAHSLAVVAASMGADGAPWIAAASLDRYLQMKGEPQIYGTQTIARPGAAPTADPFNRDLVPDALRTALGVPTLVEQEAKLDAVRAAIEAARVPQ